MVRIITVDDIRSLIKKVTLKKFFHLLHEQLIEDFKNWQTFHKQARIAAQMANGVMELMPIHNNHHYAMKYASGFPNNPVNQLPNVMGLGLLCDAQSGQPLLVSEMTLLTAIRTAATSALASYYLAKQDSQTFAIIGTGAQAEFQTLAHAFLLPIETVLYTDCDHTAMKKFANNLANYSLNLQAVDNINTLCDANIVTTATATTNAIISTDCLHPGLHINCMGSDGAGKTELAPDLLASAKLVVEYAEQTRQEGELSRHPEQAYTELWEIVAGLKPGRFHADEITVFDSVGFALEDYSTLRLVHRLAEELHIGHLSDMIPRLTDPKNLFTALT